MRITLMLLLILASTTVQAQDCVIGNSDPVFAYDAGWVEDTTFFAQLVYPLTSGCSCTPGFVVDAIRLSLFMGVGASVQVRAQLHDVIDDSGCLSPGPVFDTSEAVLFDSVPALGLYEIAIPSSFVCALMTEPFFLVVEVVTVTGFVEMPYANSNTGVPWKQLNGLCSAYTDTGAGWVDMVDAGFPGGMPITAEVTCCGAPIVEETDTWGTVKSLYR